MLRPAELRLSVAGGLGEEAALEFVETRRLGRLPTDSGCKNWSGEVWLVAAVLSLH